MYCVLCLLCGLGWNSHLVWIQSEVGMQQVPCVSMIVMVHLIHVVGWVADLHVQTAVGHGLPLYAFTPVYVCACVWCVW